MLVLTGMKTHSEPIAHHFSPQVEYLCNLQPGFLTRLFWVPSQGISPVAI
jgi:hypothetical protein